MADAQELLGLPPDVLLGMLSYLTPADLLGAVSLVCKTWHRLGAAQRLWAPSFFLLPTKEGPDERTCHSAAVMGHKMYVLGGMAKSNTIHGIKGELCVLNLKTMNWSMFSADDGYDVPGFTEHSCVSHKDRLYVFGGFRAPDTSLCSKDLWEVKEARCGAPVFKKVRVDGDRVQERSAHVAVVHNDAMFVSGGWNCRNALTFNDFYQLNLNTMQWTRLPPSPKAVRAHTGFTYSNQLFLFGGCDNTNESLQDLQCYDIATKTWSLPTMKGVVPKGRSRCRGVLHDGHFILVGGWDRQTYYNDLYVLNMDTLVWRQISTHSMPAVVQHSVVLYEDRLFAFGGFVREQHPARVRTVTIDGKKQRLPAVPSPEQQKVEDQEGQLSNALYCYVCSNAISYPYTPRASRRGPASPSAITSPRVCNSSAA